MARSRTRVVRQVISDEQSSKAKPGVDLEDVRRERFADLSSVNPVGIGDTKGRTPEKRVDRTRFHSSNVDPIGHGGEDLVAAHRSRFDIGVAHSWKHGIAKRCAPRARGWVSACALGARSIVETAFDSSVGHQGHESCGCALVIDRDWRAAPSRVVANKDGLGESGRIRSGEPASTSAEAIGLERMTEDLVHPNSASGRRQHDVCRSERGGLALGAPSDRVAKGGDERFEAWVVRIGWSAASSKFDRG